MIENEKQENHKIILFLDKMTSQTTIETLSNEILLYIFSHVSWTDLLTSFWSLNIRFNALVCLTLSVNSNLLNTGLVITLGSSYNKLHSTLLPLILNSSYLSSCIQRIHFDERNSIVRDRIYQWLFNDKEILFPNLKSLILTQCRLMEPLIESLVYLIEHQLDELILNFGNDNSMVPDFVTEDSPWAIDQSNSLFVILPTLKQNKFYRYVVEFIFSTIEELRNESS